MSYNESAGMMPHPLFSFSGNAWKMCALLGPCWETRPSRFG